jgi:hypothetical protein
MGVETSAAIERLSDRIALMDRSIRSELRQGPRRNLPAR